MVIKKTNWKTWICKDCGHMVIAIKKQPAIWDDGHRCDFEEEVKKEKTNPKITFVSKKFKIGDWYIGCRSGSASHAKRGTLVKCYYTLNNNYKNAAYILLCEDGKKRSYQFIVER